jgi:hypothetical protein
MLSQTRSAPAGAGSRSQEVIDFLATDRTMKLRTTLASTLLVAASAATWAQSPAASTPGVDARQERQEARIQQGAASGTLTGRETRQLERQQRAIEHAEGRAKADGTVTARERAGLQHLQNKSSRSIRHQKHDRQHRAASAP